MLSLAAFLLNLQGAGADFCADMPDANKLTIGIMALIAQNERETISARKARGLPLGNLANPTPLRPHLAQLPATSSGLRKQTSARPASRP